MQQTYKKRLIAFECILMVRGGLSYNRLLGELGYSCYPISGIGAWMHSFVIYRETGLELYCALPKIWRWNINIFTAFTCRHFAVFWYLYIRKVPIIISSAPVLWRRDALSASLPWGWSEKYYLWQVLFQWKS